MKTILAIDSGKSKSVFCKMDTIELETPVFRIYLQENRSEKRNLDSSN